MRLDEAVSEYQLATYYLTPSTSRWYRSKLQAFMQWARVQGVTELEDVTPQLVRRYLKERIETPSEYTGKPRTGATNHGYAQVIKGFLNWCWREELIDKEVARRIVSPRIDQKVIGVFTLAQTRRLFIACEQEMSARLAARDRAILAVLLDTGIRAAELCALTFEDTHLQAKEAYIKVLGKGRKEREVGLGKESSAYLSYYMNQYRKAHHSDQPVFVGRFHEPLTPSGLLQIIERLGIWAGVWGVRCTPHTFRHTFALRFIEQGGDIYALSRLLGHGSVSVTEVYLRAYQARTARNGPSVLDNLA